MAWICFGCGPLAFTLGQVVYYYHVLVRHDSPFPSLADVAYLSVYPFLIAGVLLLPGVRPPARRAAGTACCSTA